MKSKELVQAPEDILSLAIYTYIGDCEVKRTLPTVAGFSVANRTSHDFLEDMAVKYEIVNVAYVYLKNRQQDLLIQGGLTRKYDSGFAKFLLSANHGMREVSGTDVTSNGKQLEGLVIIKDK